MAQRVLVRTYSDLSEEPEAHSVTFGFEGKEYEIDLTDVEHKDLAEVLAPFISVARVTRTGKAGRPPGRKK